MSKPRKPFHKRSAWSILFFDLTLMPWIRTCTAPFIARKPWAAFLATFATHPIAGMFYLGRWKRALLYSLLSPLFILLEMYLLLHVNDMPNPPFFLMESLVLRLIGSVDAYFIARSWQQPEKRRLYTRWYAAIGLWLLSIALLFTGYTIFRFTVAEVYSATADINKPNILKDDFFLLWKKPHSYQPGDIAYFEQSMYGAQRGLFWRVIAMPGDTVEIKDSQFIINGKPIETKPLGEGLYEQNLANGEHYRIFSKHPPTAMPLQTLKEGEYFLLSDNRDIYLNTDFFDFPQFIRQENLKGKIAFVCKAPCPLKGKI